MPSPFEPIRRNEMDDSTLIPKSKNTPANKRVKKIKWGRKKDIAVTALIIIGVLLFIIGSYAISEQSKGEEQAGPVPLSEDASMRFEFNLASSGKHSIDVGPGEAFTVSYRIYRTDSDSDFIIHSVQDEIEFDTDIFELIEESISCGYTVSIHQYDGARCRVFMNTYAATPAGFEYKQGEEFGSFTLKVRDSAPAGSYDITNNNCEMSASGGYSLYSHTVKDLTVNISISE